MPVSMLPLLVEEVPEVSPEVARLQVSKWAQGDVGLFSVAFLVCSGDIEKEDSYRYQIGRIVDGKLVTTKKIIRELAERAYDAENEPGFTRMYCRVIEAYSKMAGIVPPWGFEKYYLLLEKGRTPRDLHGPNPTAGLKKHERRKYIPTRDGDVYGPLYGSRNLRIFR